MAALVPLTGATTTPGPVHAPAPPLPGAPPDPGPAASATFTAFPASYGAFGNGDSGYGTVGVKDGSLTVVAQAPAQAPAANADPPPADPPASLARPPAGSAKAGAGDPPPGDPPPAPPPVATLPPQPLPKTFGLGPPSLAGPFPADQAQAAAQVQQQQQQDAQETQNQLLTQSLQDVTFHIAAANGVGNTAAAQQLAPIAVQITGQLQNRIWAGIGATPPQPFASPEIPTVFLNFPA